MNNTLFSTSCFVNLFLVFSVSGQTPNIESSNNLAIPQNFNTVMFVKQKLLPKEERKGSPFLLEKEKKGVLYAKQHGTLSGFDINYNLENKEFEIYLKDQIMVIYEVEIDSFEIETSKHILKKYVSLLLITSKLNSSPLSGYAEVIERKNQFLIVQQLNLKIKQPNFNQATNTGNRFETVNITNTPYLISDDNYFKFPLNNKKLKQIFKDRFDEIEAYSKRKNLKLNSIDDFIQFINSY